MTYIEQARQVLLAELPYTEAELTTALTDLYTLLVLTVGEDCTSKHVHDAWAVAMWRHHPNHRSLVPFGDLTPAVQALDVEFRDAVRRAAKRLKNGVS